MSINHQSYMFIAIFMVVALMFPLVPLAVARLWAHFYSPQKPGDEKNATYECGLESTGDSSVRFKSEYYLYAILFLVFA